MCTFWDGWIDSIERPRYNGQFFFFHLNPFMVLVYFKYYSMLKLFYTYTFCKMYGRHEWGQWIGQQRATSRSFSIGTNWTLKCSTTLQLISYYLLLITQTQHLKLEAGARSGGWKLWLFLASHGTLLSTTLISHYFWRKD